MGQFLSSVGLPHYLQYILFTIFPSLLLITQLYHVCYVVNKQRDDAIHETIRLHQKKYFESLADVHKKLESLDSDKKNLLVNLEDQKRLSEEAFKQEMAYVHDSMRQNEYHLRVTNAAMDHTTAKMNVAYDNFTKSNYSVHNKIRDLEAIDTILVQKVERLEVANRGYFKKAYQSLNIAKRSSTQAATRRRDSLLQAQIFELSAHVERLNRTVYDQGPSVAQQAPSSPPSVGASTSASIRVHVPSSSSTRSNKFKNSVRRKYDHVLNTKKRASWTSMMSTLRVNLKPGQHQSDGGGGGGSSIDSSDASTSSSNDQPTTSSTTSATTASTATVESRIDSLYLTFSKQLKGIHTKIDRLASKVKKSRHPQATTMAHCTPGDSSSNQQIENTAPLDLQVTTLRDQVTDLHRGLIAKEKCYEKNIETLQNDIAAMSTKQKDSQDELVELLCRYEATTAFQMKKIGDSEYNIEVLQDANKRHQESLDLLAQTLGKLEQEINEATPSFDKSRATTATTATTTSVVLHEKQRREDQRLMVPSAAKFINHMEGALKSDQAILDHNSKKLYALQQKLESTREAENLKIQRELLDKEFNKALRQIAMIKKKIEHEFQYPPPLQQEGEYSRAVNQRRDQFLRQYMALHEQALKLNIKLMALCPGQLLPL